MKRFYSRSTGTTYLAGLHTSIPADAVEISEERFRSVIANPPPGKIIEHDAQGLPYLADLPPMSLDEVLNSLHARQSAQVERGCGEAITAGFASHALGAPHRYSSELDDQLNLTGAILRGLDMPYACRDEQGVKAFRLHTAAQLRQVGDDFTLYKLQLLQHANELKQQLDLALEAGDAEAMAQIRWEAVQP